MLHIKHLQCEWIDLNIISLQSLRIALWHWHFTIHVSFICAQCECTRACERVKKVHDKIQWFSRLDEFASVVYFLRVRRKKKYHSNFIGPCRLYLLPQFIHKLYNNAMFAMTSFIVCICVCVCDWLPSTCTRFGSHLPPPPLFMGSIEEKQPFLWSTNNNNSEHFPEVFMQRWALYWRPCIWRAQGAITTHFDII